MPQLGHNSSKLCTQRKWKRQKREEEEPRGSHRQVHLQETAEKGRAGDQNITYIVIDSDHEKSSEEDEVSITVICIKKVQVTLFKKVFVHVSACLSAYIPRHLQFQISRALTTRYFPKLPPDQCHAETMP